jgi:hypothetical protein
MANSHPRLENLKRYQPRGEQALAGRVFVRVPLEIEIAIRSRPDAPEWLRQVLTEAVQREIQSNPPGDGKCI